MCSRDCHAFLFNFVFFCVINVVIYVFIICVIFLGRFKISTVHWIGNIISNIPVNEMYLVTIHAAIHIAICVSYHKRGKIH